MRDFFWGGGGGGSHFSTLSECFKNSFIFISQISALAQKWLVRDWSLLVPGTRAEEI